MTRSIFSPVIFFLFTSFTVAPSFAQTQKTEPDILDGPVIRAHSEGAITYVEMFGTDITPVTLKDVEKFAVGAKIEVKKKTDFGWTELQFEMDSAKLTLTRTEATSEKAVQHLNAFTDFMFVELAGKKMDAHVYHLIRKIKRTNHIYRLHGEPAMPAASIAFVKKFAAKSNSLVQAGGSVQDPNLQELLGQGGKASKSAELPEFESATIRKARSELKLAEKKLEPAPTLPNIAADEETILRDAKEVAKRALCLLAVAAHAEQAPDFKPIEFVKKHGAFESLSPDEKEFLENEKLTGRERSVMTWRYEGLWTLLWSLGQVEELGFPDKLSDAKVSIGIVLKDADDLIKNAKLRDKAEILDQADLLYRSYWLIRDSQQKQKPIEGLSGSVVYERLYALNWLIQYMKADWDDTVVDS